MIEKKKKKNQQQHQHIATIATMSIEQIKRHKTFIFSHTWS